MIVAKSGLEKVVSASVGMVAKVWWSPLLEWNMAAWRGWSGVSLEWHMAIASRAKASLALVDSECWRWRREGGGEMIVSAAAGERAQRRAKARAAKRAWHGVDELVGATFWTAGYWLAYWGNMDFRVEEMWV